MRERGGVVFMDSTHCTTKAELLPSVGPVVRDSVSSKCDRQLYNLLVRGKDGDGVIVASFYLDVHDAVTVRSAINCLVARLYERHGFVWHPKEVFTDDSDIEALALQFGCEWSTATRRLCVWHILERNMRARLTSAFSLTHAAKVNRMVWATVRHGGRRRDISQLVVQNQVLFELVDAIYAVLQEPFREVQSNNAYHINQVKFRLSLAGT